MPVVTRPDVEGELVGSAAPAGGYAKRLPATTAWWTPFNPDALADVPDSVVQAVDLDGDGHYLIRYRAGVQPLDLDRLREVLNRDGPLAAWRTARLARDLVGDLLALHEAEFPQMLVHPERVALAGERFALLPTFAGVLPPFPQMPAPTVAGGWLNYLAPEVLRTRGTDRELLERGDVFALGVLLLTTASLTWQPLDSTDTLLFAEHRVESADGEQAGRMPAGFEPLEQLFARMAARRPDDRPTPAAAAAELDAVLATLAPDRAFAGALARSRAEAAGVLKDADATLKVPAFRLPRRAVHLMHADWHLSESPPNCPRAITYLTALSPEEVVQDEQVYLRRGRAYAGWNPPNLTESESAFQSAVLHSGCAPAVQDEWLTAFGRLGPPAEVLDATDWIPEHLRSRAVVLARVRRWLEFGHLAASLKAWVEVVELFPGRPPDADLVARVREVAAAFADPVDLMYWLGPNRENADWVRRYAAAAAIVWEANGNEDEAAKCWQLVGVPTP